MVDTTGFRTPIWKRTTPAASVPRGTATLRQRHPRYLVADTIGYSSTGDKPTSMSWGIYLDSFAGGYEVTGNITYRDPHGGIMLQGGKDNRVTNNIFRGQRCQMGLLANYIDNSRGQVLGATSFTGPS